MQMLAVVDDQLSRLFLSVTSWQSTFVSIRRAHHEMNCSFLNHEISASQYDVSSTIVLIITLLQGLLHIPRSQLNQPCLPHSFLAAPERCGRHVRQHQVTLTAQGCATPDDQASCLILHCSLDYPQRVADSRVGSTRSETHRAKHRRL